MDWFDVAEHEERLIALASSSQGRRALVVGVESDILFPLHQQREMAELLTRCGMAVNFQALASVQGHDAFLVDKVRFAPLMSEFFMAS